MKQVLIIFLVLIFSCNEKNPNDLEIIFEDSEKISFFNFDSLNVSTDNVVFKEYSSKKAILDKEYGKAAFFLIDFNGNEIFNDKDDVLIIRDISSKTPNSFSKTNTIESNLLFSINESVIQFEQINKDNKSYKGKYKLSKSIIDSVNKNNRKFDKIPNVNFLSIENKTYNFKDFENKKKYIYVDFWISSCSPCIQQIPDIKKVHSKYHEQVEVISVNSDNLKKRGELVNEIIKKHEMNWLQGVTNSNLKKQIDFNLYPQSYLFDENGKLISSDMSPIKLLKLLENQANY